MDKTSGKKQSFFPILVCMFLGFIAITISSKNSFLYAFNDSGDVQVFVTTARCILRGDVLYRDVFDVKGPYHYVFYVLGLLMEDSSFLGIYLVESVLFMGYMVLAYKIASLYLDNAVLCVMVSGASAFVATVTYDMYGGGQCEEFVLPFLAMAMFIVLKYFRRQYPHRIKWYQVTVIGILTAVVFWIKYTLTGLFLGIVLYVLCLQIKERKWKELGAYIGQFLAGFLIGSIPVLCYFGWHNAFADLWQVYFYDLLFAYKSALDKPNHFLTDSFYLYYIGASALSAFALVFPIVDGGKHMKMQERMCMVSMVLMEAVGISCGRRWWYSAESMHVFAILGAVGIIYALKDCLHRKRELLEGTASAVNRVLNGRIYRQWYFLPAAAAVLLVVGNRIFVLPIVVVVGAVCMAKLLRACYCRICGDNAFHKKVFLLKYLILVILYYGAFMITQSTAAAVISSEDVAVSWFFGITVLLTALEDYYFYEDIMRDRAKKLLDRWKKEYQEDKVKIHWLAGVLAVVMFGFYCYIFSKSTYDIGREVEKRPQYELSAYIKNSGIENPRIINYKNIDRGVYWLTGTYPPAKYSCGFNLDIPEIEEMYAEYIEGQKADFIIVEDEEYRFEGYRMVYIGTDVYVNIQDQCTLILLEKIRE